MTANRSSAFPKSLLWLPEAKVNALLRHYDYLKKPGDMIEGYDKDHALRTAKMSAAVAHYLGYDEARIQHYQIACLLHDLGRAGLDQELFGKIWTWARAEGLPTRPAEWRARYPETKYGEETEAFLEKYGDQLNALQIPTDPWAKEQIEMRLGYARRLNRLLEQVIPKLKTQGIAWFDWMEAVILYYYYPEKLSGASDWVHQLAEILMSCEQLEAYSNRTRGRDYYNRNDESFAAAFKYLNHLKEADQLSEGVLSAVCELTARGVFDKLLEEAKGTPVSEEERCFLRSLNTRSIKYHG